MNNSNRDLLVLFKQELKNPQAIDREVSWLHDLLYSVENIDNLVTAHELIDLCKYKVINKQRPLREFLRNNKEKPFVFLNNKN